MITILVISTPFQEHSHSSSASIFCSPREGGSTVSISSVGSGSPPLGRIHYFPILIFSCPRELFYCFYLQNRECPGRHQMRRIKCLGRNTSQLGHPGRARRCDKVTTGSKICQHGMPKYAAQAPLMIDAGKGFTSVGELCWRGRMSIPNLNCAATECCSCSEGAQGHSEGES